MVGTTHWDVQLIVHWIINRAVHWTVHWAVHWFIHWTILASPLIINLFLKSNALTLVKFFLLFLPLSFLLFSLLSCFPFLLFDRHLSIGNHDTEESKQSEYEFKSNENNCHNVDGEL